MAENQEKDKDVKACHRMYIASTIAAPQINPITKHQELAVQKNLDNIPCLKAKCVLFNAEAGECWDVSAARGMAKLPKVIEQIEGFQRASAIMSGE